MSDFMTLRTIQEDLKEAKKDLAICQNCVTCAYFGCPPELPPCKRCMHNDFSSSESHWRWRLERNGGTDHGT